MNPYSFTNRYFCFISGDSLDLADSNRLLDCLSNIVSSEGVEIEYFHSSDQIEIIESYKNAFGCDESAALEFFWDFPSSGL